MSDLPLPVDLRAGGIHRDYPSIWADIKRLIPYYCPEWTYQGDDDPGSALGQILAYLSDWLHHRNDTTLRDTRPSRTVYRHLIREYAEWLGYWPRRASPAQVDCRFSIAVPLAGDLIVEAPLKSAADETSGTVYFETQGRLTIPAGQTSVTLATVEGESVTGYSLGTATGRAFERFVLADASAIFNYGASDFVVKVDGIEATLVRWPSEGGPDDLIYWVRELRDRTLQIRFGNGKYGALLTKGVAITVDYRRGGGTRGRVRAGAVSRVVTQVLYNGAPVTLSVTNLSRSVGGLPEEDLEEIRHNAPAYFRTQNRAVTRDDYEVLVRSVPGVFRARAVASGVDGVLINVVPEGAEEGDVLTDVLKGTILATLDSKKMATDALAIRQADLIPIDVELEVHAHRGQRNDVVQGRVQKTFKDPNDTDAGLLAAAQNDLGTVPRLSDMVHAVEKLEGVNYVDVYRYARRPTVTWKSRVGNAEFSAAGVTITDRTKEQTWYVEFLTNTTFAVSGSLSGRQRSPGSLGVAFSDSGGEISFTIEAGTIAMAPGDRAEIRVSRLVWNVTLGANEFPVAGKINIRVVDGIG